MADVSLTPRSSLDALVMPRSPAFSLTEAPPAGRFLFRGDEAARKSCSLGFRVELPHRLGIAAEGLDRAALWLGPDEWLLIAGDADPELFSATIASALGEALHSLVDVSHRQVGIVVDGAGAARALSAGCPLDLRERAFPVGFATRTLFEKTEIVLWRRGAESFHVEAWRSFAPHLVAALTEAARGAPIGQFN
jgi:sarcosine oxidase, subunit gamma